MTKITEALEQHQMRLMKDSAVLDKMYEQNLAYFKELSMYILAGKKKLREVREGKLNELHQKAAASGLRKMHRLPMIWKANATALRKSFMIWSLPEPFLCRLHRRSA